MPLSCDWDSKLITVPLSELSLIEGTRYKLTVDHWYSLVAELNGSDQGIVQTVNEPLYENTSPTPATPRIVDLINGYTVQFIDATGILISVDVVDGNTNIKVVEVKNIVSVGTNNVAALINPVVLEAGVFAGKVVYNVGGVSGTGKTPAGELIGTFRAPSGNVTDSLAIAYLNGLNTLYASSSIDIYEDLSSGYALEGNSPYNLVTCHPEADLTGCSLINLSVQGELDGLNVLTRCSLFTVTGVSGFLEKCAFSSSVTTIGAIYIFECYSQVEGLGFFELIPSNHNIVMRDFHGSVKITGMTGGIHSIEINGGRLVLDTVSCTGGIIYARGKPFDIVGVDGAGTVVVEQFDRGLSTVENTKLLSIPTKEQNALALLDEININV